MIFAATPHVTAKSLRRNVLSPASCSFHNIPNLSMTIQYNPTLRMDQLDQSLIANIISNLNCTEICRNIIPLSKQVNQSTTLQSVWSYRHSIELPQNILHSISPTYIQQILLRMPNLKSAPISQWIPPEQIDDTNLTQLLAATSASVESIDLSYCRGASQTSILQIASNFNSLKTLVLEGNSNTVTDDLLEQILPSLGNLETLNLAWCPKITSNGLFSIARNCPKLQNIDLTSCQNINDEGLIAISHTCKDLRRVFISQTHISNATLYALSLHAKRLRTVHLNGCRFVSENGVMDLVRNAKYLRKLEVLGCVSLDHQTVQEIIENYAQIKVGRYKRELNAESKALISSLLKNIK